MSQAFRILLVNLDMRLNKDSDPTEDFQFISTVDRKNNGYSVSVRQMQLYKTHAFDTKQQPLRSWRKPSIF